MRFYEHDKYIFPQAVSPGVVATEFAPRIFGKTNPKDAIQEVYSQFDYPVSTLAYSVLKNRIEIA